MGLNFPFIIHKSLRETFRHKICQENLDQSAKKTNKKYSKEYQFCSRKRK